MVVKNGLVYYQEWIDLLREMVMKLPEVPNLHSFKILCSDDPEVDFFNNIIHLQVSFSHHYLMTLHMLMCISFPG